ncbi:hypothetical protein RHMOL_Rhmol10G0193900 [Rhododendron molle]|uniref:Uncharacterized protein n=1 Tax=Rhododendron molle TaxID=49168 RepID=A0ACC0M3S0_RHOML|nr:hypothetical protein RHMOL_Rhmol10G0193900 [Rhododendron molle]
MLDVYKGLPVICLYCEKGPELLQIIYPDEVDVPHVETNIVHLDDESPKANEGNHEVVVDIPMDEGIGDDEDEPDYVGDEDDEDENEDDEDGSDVSSTPSRMFENLEGPGDDDIFASKEQQNQAKDDKEQPKIEDWIPCKHACAAIGLNKQKVEKYVQPCYSRDTYLGVHYHMIQPIPGKHDWVKSNQEEIHPPFMRRPSGRPRKARRKAAEEVEDAGTGTLSRAGSKNILTSTWQEQKGQPKQKKSRTTAPKTSTQPSVDAGFYTKPAQLFAPINSGFYTQPNQGSANSANLGFSSQRWWSKGGGKTGASRGGGRLSSPRGGGRSGATRGGGRVGATRGGGRAGATRGGGRAGATRGGGRTGGPRGGGRSGAAQTSLAQIGVA